MNLQTKELTSFSKSKIKGRTPVNLENANLEGFNLEDANLRGAILKSAILKGAILKGARLKHAILEGANLEGANLDEADCSNANLKLAKLNGIILRKTNFISANFEGTNLIDVKFFNYYESTGRVIYPALWESPEINLYNANFNNADCSNANFKNAILTKAKFENAILTKANFEYANLKNANFKNANLTESNFTGAHLEDANFEDANLSRAVMSGAYIYYDQLTLTQHNQIRGYNRIYLVRSSESRTVQSQSIRRNRSIFNISKNLSNGNEYKNNKDKTVLSFERLFDHLLNKKNQVNIAKRFVIIGDPAIDSGGVTRTIFQKCYEVFRERYFEWDKDTVKFFILKYLSPKLFKEFEKACQFMILLAKKAKVKILLPIHNLLLRLLLSDKPHDTFFKNIERFLENENSIFAKKKMEHIVN